MSNVTDFIDIQSKFDLIDDEITRLKKRMVGLNKRQCEAVKSAEKAIDRISRFSPSEVEEFLASAKNDAANLHKKYRALIIRVTVSTEMAYLARGAGPKGEQAVAARIIRAFDYDDDWWLERENQSLEKWMKELINFKEVA